MALSVEIGSKSEVISALNGHILGAEETIPDIRQQTEQELAATGEVTDTTLDKLGLAIGRLKLTTDQIEHIVDEELRRRAADAPAFGELAVAACEGVTGNNPETLLDFSLITNYVLEYWAEHELVTLANLQSGIDGIPEDFDGYKFMNARHEIAVLISRSGLDVKLHSIIREGGNKYAIIGRQRDDFFAFAAAKHKQAILEGRHRIVKIEHLHRNGNSHIGNDANTYDDRLRTVDEQIEDSKRNRRLLSKTLSRQRRSQ